MNYEKPKLEIVIMELEVITRLSSNAINDPDTESGTKFGDIL